MQQLHLFTPPEPKGRRNQRGAELVEFALIFPVLMLFIVAALSLLWLGFMKVAAAQSAKEAARYASVPVNCSGDLGGPLVSVPAVPPTLPDGTPVPVPVPTIPQNLPVTIPPTTVTVPDVAVQQLPMKQISYQQLVTVPTTLPITVPTTLPVTIPTILPTTTTVAPTTTTSITLPPTTLPPTTLPATTLPPATTTTLDPNRQCTSNFRTYPDTKSVKQSVDKRVPVWHFDPNEYDIVYTYNDPACPGPQPADHREGDPTCPTPKPNDPPPNSQVSVKVTKTVQGPLSVFARIFNGSNTISANSGGETRGE